MIIRWLINAVVLLGCAYLIPGIHVDGFVTALIAVVVIGAINMVVRPIFMILTIPITIVTLGLFLFVINALMFYFAGSILAGFRVDGALAAFLGSLVYSVAGTMLTPKG
jgi:putative membrane protein